MRSILQDLRFGVRQLRSAPGFTLTALTVLALALGANVGVFTVLNGILLRPLPYPHPDRVVQVDLDSSMRYNSMRYANMLQLRDAVGSGMKLGVVFDGNPISVVGPGGRVQLDQTMVSAGLFDMLGVQPILGRTFREEENQPGRNRVLLIGYDVWQQLYKADPQVVGTTVMIRTQPYTIVGVLPRGFFFWYSNQLAVWSPAEIPQAAHSGMMKGAKFGSMFARVPDGMSLPAFAANLNRVQANIAREVPGDEVPSRLKVAEYQRQLTSDARRPVTLLYAVVFGIWALACLNVTSLTLARAVSRMREHAVRSALGASRGRLLQQALVESLLLSGAGAMAGLLLGEGAIKLLWTSIKRYVPLTYAIHVDWRVYAFLISLTLATACIIGILPAIHVMGNNVREKLAGASFTSTARANRTREVLVAAQLALTLVFLVGAGLFLRTIHALRQVPLGFGQQNVLTGGVILNGNSHQFDPNLANEQSVVHTAYLPLLERIRSIPGVKTAALSSVLPMRTEMAATVSAGLDHKQDVMALGRVASPGLTDALGIPMIRGRFFTDDDTASSPAVVVVNQAFAEKYLPGQDPVGHIVFMGKGRFNDSRIVGVIGDVKQQKLTETTEPELYFCLAQAEPGTSLYGIASAFIQVAIRASVPAETLRAQFDRVLHEVAPDATTTNVKTIHEAVEDSFGSQKLIAYLLDGFAAVALMIAAIGLYGLLSFAVAQRTREIGVRIALGAQQGNIVSLVLRRAFSLIGIGICIGGALSWFAARLTSAYIYGVRPHDAATFAAVTAVLAAASLLAAWLPARRAASVDPILALRSE